MMTVTSLPACAASARASTIAESLPARYSVCLMARTCGSLGRLLDEIRDGAEALERVVQQYVAGAQSGEQIAAHAQPLGNARA